MKWGKEMYQSYQRIKEFNDNSFVISIEKNQPIQLYNYHHYDKPIADFNLGLFDSLVVLPNKNLLTQLSQGITIWKFISNSTGFDFVKNRAFQMCLDPNPFYRRQTSLNIFDNYILIGTGDSAQIFDCQNDYKLVTTLKTNVNFSGITILNKNDRLMILSDNNRLYNCLNGYGYWELT
jgi:hypothetical protein